MHIHDHANAYWTGYFTSRPALKGYTRMMSAYYLATRQLEFFKGKREVRNREAGEVRKKEGELAGGGTSGKKKKEKKKKQEKRNAVSFTWNEEKNKEKMGD